jgi:hypothetical protein
MGSTPDVISEFVGFSGVQSNRPRRSPLHLSGRFERIIGLDSACRGRGVGGSGPPSVSRFSPSRPRSRFHLVAATRAALAPAKALMAERLGAVVAQPIPPAVRDRSRRTDSDRCPRSVTIRGPVNGREPHRWIGSVRRCSQLKWVAGATSLSREPEARARDAGADERALQPDTYAGLTPSAFERWRYVRMRTPSS